MKLARRFMIVAVVFLVFSAPGLAQVLERDVEDLASLAEAPQGLQISSVQQFELTADPYFGPVEVQVHTEHPTVAQGSLNDVYFAVLNHSNEATVSINIDLDLIYADGREVVPFHLGADRQKKLGPNEGFLFLIFWQVPPDAPLGKATFRVEATVGRLTPPVNEITPVSSNPRVASDFVEFDVVP